MSSSITDALRRIGGGTLVDEANDKLSALVQAVETTGKAGSLTLKLTLKKVGGGALAADGRVIAAIPADKPQVTLFFSTPEGSLLTEDPKQQKLPLRPVAADAPRELKSNQG